MLRAGNDIGKRFVLCAMLLAAMLFAGAEPSFAQGPPPVPCDPAAANHQTAAACRADKDDKGVNCVWFNGGCTKRSNACMCTTDQCFNIVYPAAGTGIISLVVANISAIINNVAAALYSNIIADSGFQTAVRAGLTIY